MSIYREAQTPKRTESKQMKSPECGDGLVKISTEPEKEYDLVRKKTRNFELTSPDRIAIGGEFEIPLENISLEDQSIGMKVKYFIQAKAKESWENILIYSN